MSGCWLFCVHTGRQPRPGPSCAARPRARRVHRPSLTTYCALWVPVAGNSDAQSAARAKHRSARNHAGQLGLKKPLPAESEPRSSQTPARTREPEASRAPPINGRRSNSRPGAANRGRPEPASGAWPRAEPCRPAARAPPDGPMEALGAFEN